MKGSDIILVLHRGLALFKDFFATISPFIAIGGTDLDIPIVMAHAFHSPEATRGTHAFALEV
jgi:hypothetical protein